MRTVLVCLLTLQLLLNPIPAAGQSGQSTPSAQPAASGSEATRLPVRRVVLYKNGVGYFEHLGRVRGSGEVSIEFTSGQLNDVLKSLTTLDLSGGRITGVNYNSDAPLTRRLGALRLPLDQDATLTGFLNAMRGARLEVRTGTAALIGRLLSVERKTRINGGTTLEADHLAIVNDTGEVRTVEMSPAVSVRVIDSELKSEVARYLDVIGSTRTQDLRRITISTAGSGERQLFVSYISEVPVWKTTYRIVLPSKPTAKPLLQGWAIVDNTVGEDWKDVELSLVAGAPQSFVQQLSQPYYSRRPVVSLPETAMLTPQTHQATLIGGYGRLAGRVTDPGGAVIPGAAVRVYDEQGSLVATQSSDQSGNYQITWLPSGIYRVEVENPGFKKMVIRNLQLGAGADVSQEFSLQVGDVAETVTVTASSTAIETQNATTRGSLGRLGSGRALGSGRGLASGPGEGGGVGSAAGSAVGLTGGVSGVSGGGVFRAGFSGVHVAASAQQLGDLFEYKLEGRVTIRQNQSAMVPIVQTDIAVEKVSLWNEARGNARPLRALWLTNSSNLTLDGGSFSVLEDETFAGEGLTEALKPGEKRLLSYAVDLGLLVDSKRDSERQHVTRVRIQRGVMTHVSEERETRTYTIRNEDTIPRSIVIEHPVRPEWKLSVDTPEPSETSLGSHRFRITAEPKKTATLGVTEHRPIAARYGVAELDQERIALFVRQKNINPQVEQALRPVLAQKNIIADLESQISEREAQRDEIFDDQQRVRENMKALKGSSEEKQLLQRYTRQLDQQESQLDALRAEIAGLEQKRDAAREELNRMTQELTLDAAL